MHAHDRGGGNRGRTGGGGKHNAMDPIVPVEDPDILQVSQSATWVGLVGFPHLADQSQCHLFRLEGGLNDILT